MRHVRVQDRLYERQGFKSVLPANGLPVEVPVGEVPDPGAELLAFWGEPTFELRLERGVSSKDDLPAQLVSAMPHLMSRLSMVTPEGHEGGGMHVEGVTSFIQDEALVLVCDTDGTGYTPEMIDTMARIIVDELEPLALPVALSVPVARQR